MSSGPRYQGIDIARGVAFVAMFVYHAAWFASARGLVHLELASDPGWRAFQRSIAGSFYLLVGVSLVLANRDRIRVGPTLARLARIAGGALVVTGASAVLDRSMLVRYGILHNIAVCSVLALPLLRLGGWNLLLGALAVAVGSLVSTPALDGPALDWIGLGTKHARTFDHQPLLPWLGVVLWGVALGQLAARSDALARWSSDGRAARSLGLLGRHTLLLYLAHVPVLVVSVELVAWCLGR